MCAVNEQWIGKDVEGSCQGIIWTFTLAFAWNKWGKPWKMSDRLPRLRACWLWNLHGNHLTRKFVCCCQNILWTHLAMKMSGNTVLAMKNNSQSVNQCVPSIAGHCWNKSRTLLSPTSYSTAPQSGYMTCWSRHSRSAWWVTTTAISSRHWTCTVSILRNSSTVVPTSQPYVWWTLTIQSCRKWYKTGCMVSCGMGASWTCRPQG